MFVILQWSDKPGTNSGEFENYKQAVEGAKKLSRQTGQSVVVRHLPTGTTWARFVDGRKVVW